MKDIKEIDTKSEEGKMLMASLALITGTSHTDKTPNEVLEIVAELKAKMEVESDKSVQADISDYIAFIDKYSGSLDQTVVLSKTGYDKIKSAMRPEMVVHGQEYLNEEQLEVEDGKLLCKFLGYNITVIRK